MGSTKLYAGGVDTSDAQTLPPQADHRAGASATSSESPRVFAGYTLLQEIARGGMGIVYKARQNSANRIVALKVIQSGQFAGPEDKRRFQTEAEAAASLAHPHIVPIFEVGEIGGQPYFSMGFIEGENLRRRVADGPLDNREAARIVQIVAAAMAYAHSRGILHRDLKPENVLVDRAAQPHVTDFGLAKRLEGDSQLTATGQILGTPSYMSPEQASGETKVVGVASDVYSIGAILYCLLTGRPPFQAPSITDTLLQVMQREPVSPREINPVVDRDLETLCLKCLEKDPSRRLPTAEFLSDELGRYLRCEPIVSRPLGRVARMWRWSRRNRVVAGLLATVAVSLLAGIGMSTYFAVVARSRATQAEQGRRIAVGTLQSVIFNVQKKLKPFPEAREVRRVLLKESLRDLETVSSEMSADDAVDHGTAVALVELGRLFEEIGVEGEPTAAAAAERYYLRALELYGALRAAAPNDLVLMSDHAAALSELTDLLISLNRPVEARPRIQEELDLRRQIASADPTNRDAQTLLAKALIDLGHAESILSHLERSKTLLEEAIEIRRSQDALKSPNEIERGQLALALMRLGDTCAEAGDRPAARTALESSLALSRELQSRDPKNAERAMAVSTVWERLGDYHVSVGDFAAAKASYEEMRVQTEVAIQLDPANRMNRADYPICFDKLYELAMRSGDLPEAERACSKSVELRTALVAEDASNSRHARELREDKERLAAVRAQLKSGLE